jgi:hypothetical protein
MRSDFHVPALSNAHELGDIRSPCSLPCPPSGTCREREHGGRQLVPRRVQVACTIASMGQTGADVCGLTRTCTVVANCHHRATCGFAPTCRTVTAGRSPALGLIRTVAVVPIWHHRVTWGSTEPPTPDWPVPARRTNRTTMVLPNWQNHMTWADAPGPSAGLLSPGGDVGADHSHRTRTAAARFELRKAIHAMPSTGPEKQTGQVRSRRFGGTVRPAQTLRRRSRIRQRAERIFTTSATRSSSRSTRISVPIR